MTQSVLMQQAYARSFNFSSRALIWFSPDGAGRRVGGRCGNGVSGKGIRDERTKNYNGTKSGGQEQLKRLSASSNGRGQDGRRV